MNHSDYLNLVKTMISYAKSYYLDAKPEITDQEWDTYYRQLSDFEANNPELINADSPVGKVGFAMFNETGVVPHNPPMLSLKNAMTADEAINLIDSTFKPNGTYAIEYKADGVACRLKYSNGVFKQALTRGDGVKGEDITKHISPQNIKLPNNINHVGDLIVDGELIIKYKDFDKLNQYRILNNQTPYKNTRNAVAGMLASDELSDVQKMSISFLAYDSPSEAKNLLWTINRTKLTELGFDLVEIINERNFSKIITNVLDKRDSLPYMIDGLVVKLDSYGARKRLGATSHSPRWAFSYKFPAITNKTVLESVGFTVGRTGQITGMAYFNPVDIGGVTVSKSAIDSMERWRDLRPSKGAMLTISRRADVRPYVESCESVGGTYYAFTSLCPWCNSKLEEKGKKIFCINNTCQGRNIAHITYAVGNTALDIEDLSEQKITLLCSKRIVTNVVDLYFLKEDSLISAGFTKYSAIKMLKAINDSKNTTLEKIIISFGIPLIARTISKAIVQYLTENKLNTVKNVIEIFLNKDEVSKLPIGIAAKESINNYFSVPYYALRTEFYKKIAFNLNSNSGALDNLNFCITGSLTDITRSELENRLLKAGATIQSGVSKETTALITDDKSTPPWEVMPSAKMQKAAKLNIKIISSKEAISLLTDNDAVIALKQK